MRWFDQVLAVPLLGVQISPTIWTTHTILAALRPLLTEWTDAAQQVMVETPLPMAAKVSRGDGYTIDVSTEGVSVSFAYKGVIRELPGKTARLEYVDSIPCSDLVGQVRTMLERVLELLNQSIPFKVVRYGVVVEARVEEAALPPGAAAWRDRLADGRASDTFILNVTTGVNLKKTEAHVDRCFHTIDIDQASRKDDARLRFDWQRVSVRPALFKRDGSSKSLDAVVDAALDYVEAFGSGDLSNE